MKRHPTQLPSPRRSALLFFLPTLVLLLWVLVPLLRGSETLYLRDVFAAHLPLKQAQAAAMERGELPWIDPHRAQGQPLLGNLNAAPLYPDNLLYLAAPTLWAFNAHFWLHLLLAAPAMAWLGRRCGLPSPAAWAAGAVWSLSGFYLSQMNFYNLVAGVTLTPALAAAALTLAARRGGSGAGWWGLGDRWARRALVSLALLWALLLLAGDPMTALLAALLAAAAVLALPAGGRSGRLRSLPGLLPGLLAGFAAGTLVALPQLVALLAALPGSRRGAYGYSAASATLASWDPRSAVEWLLPFAFGRLDRIAEGTFWGHAFHTGHPPFYLSLYPGLAALALVAAAVPWALGKRSAPDPDEGDPDEGDPDEGEAGEGEAGEGEADEDAAPPADRRRAFWWAAGLVATGLFLALGRFNPVAAWLFSLPLLRFPIKVWPLVAVGGSLLAGLGFEALFLCRSEGGRSEGGRSEGGRSGGSAASARRWALATLAAAAVPLAAVWLLAALAPARAFALLRPLVPARYPRSFVAAEVARLGDLAAVSLLVAAALALLIALAVRRRSAEESGRWRIPRLPPLAAGALLLAVHAVAQLSLLGPLLATDAAVPYRLPPLAQHAVAPGDIVLHGALGEPFGRLPSPSPEQLPDSSGRWLARRGHHALLPHAGVPRGLRYALNRSPEGLDSLHTTVVRAALADSDDRQRLALLAASGVDLLILGRPLDEAPAPPADSADRDPAAPGVAVERLGQLSPFGPPFHLYRLTGGLPDAALLGRVRRGEGYAGSYRLLTAPGFDPTATAVVLTDRAADARDRLPGAVEPAAVSEADGPAGEVAPVTLVAPVTGGTELSGVAPSEGGGSLWRTPDRFAARVDSVEGGVLVLARSYSPRFRAAIDGRPATPLVANMHLLALAVPAGSHRVELWIDRRPVLTAAAVAAVALIALALAAGLPAGRRRGGTPR